MKPLIAWLTIIMALTGCAARHSTQVPDCPHIYTIMPGNFIIELAAGAEITIDPGVQDFILYCKAEDAKKLLADSSLPGDWRVYEVAGEFGEIATRREDGNYFLSRPAQIIDWVEEPDSQK